MTPVRIVLDANIYIAASKPGSYSEYWVRHAGLGQFGPIELFTSEEILTEIREKLEEKIGLSREEAVRYIEGITNVANIVRPKRKITAIKDDPDDNKILEAAVEAKADLIVSSDPDLYRLKQFESTGIIHPKSLKHIFPDSK